MDLSIRVARRSAGHAVWKSVRNLLGWPGNVLAARRVMLQLGQMSPHELKDIGLSPQDLRDATALPLDADPSRRLAALARDRRRPR